MSSARRVVAIVIAAAAVGVLLSLLKGQGGGTRLTFGNLSAPWLLTAFLAGSYFTRPPRAGAAGALATVAAMIGFYAQQSPLWDLDGGSLRFLGDPGLMWRSIVAAHAIWFTAALVSGPALGLLGWLWANHRSRTAAMAMALTFVGEPLVWLALAAVAGQAAEATSYWVWGAELALGIAVCTLVARAPRRGDRNARRIRGHELGTDRLV